MSNYKFWAFLELAVSVALVVPLGVFKVHLKILLDFMDLSTQSVTAGFVEMAGMWVETGMGPNICIEWTLFSADIVSVIVGKFCLGQAN